MPLRLVFLTLLFSGCALLFTGCEKKPIISPADSLRAEEYLTCLRAHAEAVFTHAVDNHGEKVTPSFLDGVNLETLEPVIWSYDENRWVLANLANQQHLLRTLVGMSVLTGDSKYKDAATAAMEFGMTELQTANGLILWGGHTAYDARGDEWVGRRYHWLGKKRSPVHELKACYPFYDLMWEIDPEKTRRFIRVFWEAHLRNWENLDFDRHGGVQSPKRIDEEVWDREFNEAIEVGYVGKGRTFANAGSDLVYAGGMLYALDGEKPALKWAERLAEQYNRTRNPQTGLRGYQFSRPEKDRAEIQFGDLFPEKTVNEAHIFEPNYLASPILSYLRLAQRLGPRKGAVFLDSAVADLKGMAKTAYDEKNGKFKRMLLDGTDLTGIVMPRDGYFGPKGLVVGDWPAQDYFVCYTTCLNVLGDLDSEIWEMIRKLSKFYELGDVGNIDGTGLSLNMETDSTNPEFIIGLLELHKATAKRGYLDLACRIGDNIIENRFEKGFFKSGGDYKFTRVSRPESLALVHLAGTLLGKSDDLPPFLDSASFFACELKSSDPAYSFDHNVIYTQLRSD